MARGNSGKIVLEIAPTDKEKLYFAVKKDGMTMKEWFLQQMTSYLDRPVVAERPPHYGRKVPARRPAKRSPAKS